MENLDRRYLIAAAIILWLLTFMGGVKYAEYKFSLQQEELVTQLPDDNVEKNNLAEEEPTAIKEIQVYIGGAVENPMICKLTSGCRVYQAVEMAKAKEDAALEMVDMARMLTDGETIIVPRRGEENTLSQSSATVSNNLNKGTQSSNKKININKASVSELEELPGIGPALASRIVKYREDNGDFRTESDICNVSGIGEKKYANLKDLITVK
jgi:competence protein ComEA